MAQTLAQRNAEFFNDLASQYDDKPWAKVLQEQVTQQLREQLPFIGVKWATNPDQSQPVRMLDYACGTGMVTRAFGPHVTQTRGVDVSSKMVERYNEAAKNSGVPEETAHALVGNLLDSSPSPELSSPDLKDFDLVAVGLGFHHFEDHRLAVRRFTERLKPQGVVLIVDFVKGEGKRLPTYADHTIKVHGFSEETMMDIFEREGLQDARFFVMPEEVRLDLHGDKPTWGKVFFARASKPAS